MPHTNAPWWWWWGVAKPQVKKALWFISLHFAKPWVESDGALRILTSAAPSSLA
jgi:hypothetical protein